MALLSATLRDKRTKRRGSAFKKKFKLALDVVSAQKGMQAMK